MTQFVPIASAVPPTSITADTPCRKCGYNLRGLNSDSRCPECGTPIAVSVSGDWLQFCDPTWVRLLARGAKLIIVGVVVIIVGVVVSVVLTAATGGIHATRFQDLAMLVGYALILIGAWLVTSPDPSGIGEDRYGTARKLIRIALLIGIINGFINLLPIAPEVAALIDVVASIIAVVGLVAQLQYFEKLAARIPEPRLSARANFLKTALPATCLVFIIVHGIGLAVNTPGDGKPGAEGGDLVCFLAIVAVALLVFAIMYLLLIDRFSTRFTEQANLAAQHWARGLAGSEVTP